MEGDKCCPTEGGHGCCSCMCHKTPGILLVLIGVLFLLGTFDVVSPRVVSITWPILVILIGLKKSFMHCMCKCCKPK